MISLGFSIYSVVVATQERQRARGREDAEDARTDEFDSWKRTQEKWRQEQADRLSNAVEQLVAGHQTSQADPSANLAIELDHDKVTVAQIRNYGLGRADITEIRPTSQRVGDGRWGIQDPPMTIYPGQSVTIPLPVLQSNPFIVEVRYGDPFGDKVEHVRAT